MDEGEKEEDGVVDGVGDEENKEPSYFNVLCFSTFGRHPSNERDAFASDRSESISLAIRNALSHKCEYEQNIISICDANSLHFDSFSMISSVSRGIIFFIFGVQ